MIPSPEPNLPDWISALFSYKHSIVRQSIWKIKYSHTYDLCRIYGELLYQRIVADLQSVLTDTRAWTRPTIYLVPIPITKKRLRERGYNQAEIIVQAILECDRDGVFAHGAPLARREMPTRQSHTKHRSDRFRNIQGSFVPVSPISHAAYYVLIDDVVTTGATLLEAKSILVTNNASQVRAYTIAH
jgi:ComF family protein